MGQNNFLIHAVISYDLFLISGVNRTSDWEINLPVSGDPINTVLSVDKNDPHKLIATFSAGKGTPAVVGPSKVAAVASIGEFKI